MSKTLNYTASTINSFLNWIDTAKLVDIDSSGAGVLWYDSGVVTLNTEILTANNNTVITGTYTFSTSPVLSSIINNNCTITMPTETGTLALEGEYLKAGGGTLGAGGLILGLGNGNGILFPQSVLSDSSKLCSIGIYNASDTYYTLLGFISSIFTLGHSNLSLHIRGNDIYVGSIIRPETTNTYDLGTSSYFWKDLYLTGDLTDGTNSISVEDIANLTSAQTLVEITYSELVTLRDSSTLIPGSLYRITDYVTTTATDDTTSAGNYFDVIVLALDESNLSEKAWATYSDRDTSSYFADQLLESWQLWYCLDNDTDRFAWADETNGTGVIYRMIDDKGNDLPYDFKNIKMSGYYTFACNSTSYDGSVIDVTASGSGAKRNIIKPYFVSDVQTLNFIIFKAYNEYHDITVIGNFFDENCHDMTFYIDVEHNTFGKYCYSNTHTGYIGGSYGSFVGNSFGNNCYSNTFAPNVQYNKIGAYFYSNTIGNYFTHNTIGNYFYSNTIDTYFYENNIKDRFCANTIGSYFQRNIFNAAAQYNTFGDYCMRNVVNGVLGPYFSSETNNNVFGNYFSDNTFEATPGSALFTNWVLGYYGLTFGNYCSNLHFKGNNLFILGYDTVNSTTIDYIQNVEFGVGVSFINLYTDDTSGSTSNYLQNIYIHTGVGGSSSTNMLDIDIADRGLDYETEYKSSSSVEVLI